MKSHTTMPGTSFARLVDTVGQKRTAEILGLAPTTISTLLSAVKRGEEIKGIYERAAEYYFASQAKAGDAMLLMVKLPKSQAATATSVLEALGARVRQFTE